MSDLNFRSRQKDILNSMNDTLSETTQEKEKATQSRQLIQDTRKVLDDLDEQFCRQTGLTKLDMNFLFVAIGMQITRQYVLTKFPQRLDDQTAAKSTAGHGEEHSNRHHQYYNPSLEEIITNPVPFDANIGSGGKLKGGGRMGHRVTAIGHDPLLGLIFGTANIATSTLTTSSLESYHIYTNDGGRDYFKNQARTELVLGKTADKLLNQGMEGKTIVAASLMKEIIHLRSDLNTKNSLPLPAVSAIDPKLASKLAGYGLDMSNVLTVGKQASYAILINTIIAMVHGLFFEGTGSRDRKAYEVRTRKILSYSNLVASSSNVAVVAVTKDIRTLDLGGLAVNISSRITDRSFIRKVKEDFIFGSYKDMLTGNHLS